mmetsp:Transcript_93041/g.199539  ORF Transcript_93041/g.199539 Transcript_93041/m.199539 type:complete len:229 (-) Transcript_93041:263-949(-)
MEIATAVSELGGGQRFRVGPVWFPLLREGQRALLHVGALCPAPGCPGLVLICNGLFEGAGVGIGSLSHLHRDRNGIWISEVDLLSQCQGSPNEILAILHQLLRDAHLDGLGALNAASCEDHGHGILVADEARQLHDAASGGIETNSHLRKGEVRSLTDHKDVTGERQLEPPTVCYSVHRRDDGLHCGPVRDAPEPGGRHLEAFLLEPLESLAIPVAVEARGGLEVVAS